MTWKTPEHNVLYAYGVSSFPMFKHLQQGMNFQSPRIVSTGPEFDNDMINI